MQLERTNTRTGEKDFWMKGCPWLVAELDAAVPEATINLDLPNGTSGLLIQFRLGPDSDATVPPRAQAAHQQAATIAKAIANVIANKPLPTYTYKDFGSLINLSRHSTVGSLMALAGAALGGVLAWRWRRRSTGRAAHMA